MVGFIGFGFATKIPFTAFAVLLLDFTITAEMQIKAIAEIRMYFKGKYFSKDAEKYYFHKLKKCFFI